MLPKTILALNEWSNISKDSPKWRNFDKSDHTASEKIVNKRKKNLQPSFLSLVVSATRFGKISPLWQRF